MQVANPERTRVADPSAVARLRAAVADGRWGVEEPGTFEGAAELLGTDVATATAAVLDLGRDGFLRRDEQGCVVVRPIEDTVLDEALGARLLVEPAMVRDVVPRVRAADLLAMQSWLDAVDRAVDRRDFAAYGRAHDAFVGLVLDLHPNRTLVALCRDLRARTRLDGLREVIEEGAAPDVLTVHAPFVRALREDDTEAAAQLVTRFLLALRFLGAPLMDEPVLPGPARPIEAVEGDDWADDLA